ncbi:hypothetical protein [Photobacterium leiognathi]|uniref:hypothetical protein n=1 Tax=Photobacterium leiognathi TaxID=553611 RepID=UPI0027399C57|nr:hypothetical protein [Photobacterium leiognathi]
MKKHIGLLSLALLAGCGGGGGGGDNSVDKNNEEISPDSPHCGNMPEMSCTYNLNDLTFNYWLSVKDAVEGAEAPYELYGAAVMVNSTPEAVSIVEPDRIEVVSYGKRYQADTVAVGGKRLDFNNLPMDKTYEIYWYRNDDIISHAYIDDLPSGVALFEVEANQQTDTLTFSWQNIPSNPSNAGDIRYLTCTDNNNMSDLVSTTVVSYQENLTSPYTAPLTIKELFGSSLTELKTQYKTCDINITTFTSDNAITPVNYTNEAMLIHLKREQEHIRSLF